MTNDNTDNIDSAETDLEQPIDPRGADGNTDEPTGNEEAKRYRLRLRETEQQLEQTKADLDAANALVLAVRRQHIESAMIDSHEPINSSALEAAGHQLADFFTDDGALDSDKLREATKTTMARFGVQPPRMIVPTSIAIGRANPGLPDSTDKTWQDALRGERF